MRILKYLALSLVITGALFLAVAFQPISPVLSLKPMPPMPPMPPDFAKFVQQVNREHKGDKLHPYAGRILSFDLSRVL